MTSRKRNVAIVIIITVLVTGFAGSLIFYRSKLSSGNTKDISSDNIAQSLSTTSNNRYFENFYDKPITDENIALDSIEVNRDKLGYRDKNFSFEFERKDEYIGASYRFEILYKDIPLDNETIIVSAKEDGTPDLLISNLVETEKISGINVKPKITQEEAGQIIKSNLGEERKVTPELMIYEAKNEYVLSYYFDGSYKTCIINAETGKVIASYSNAVFDSVEYSGQNGDIHQVFYNNYENEDFYIKNALWDNEKNIFIINNRCDYQYDNYTNNLLTLNDLQSDKNKSAVDGMANTYRAVEYFEKHFNKRFDMTYVSVNVDNLEINGVIQKDNACARYIHEGNQESACLIFLVSSDKENPQLSAYLDIVAHEYTHTVTGSVFSANYGEESKYYERNALMEAYSDIFGELIEQEFTGKTDWYHNDKRSLIKHENSENKKDYIYEYRKKYTGTDVDGGAHWNSTIISHTAYLMSQDNDNKKYDNKYLLDYDQLRQLWYESLKYLNERSNFSDCRFAIEQSAKRLIEEGILIEENLNVIEQAFTDAGVDSDAVRHGVENSLKTAISTSAVSLSSIEIETTTTKTTTKITTTAESASTIPEEASIYNGHSYMVYPESMTWREAREYCEKLGGHLVTISDTLQKVRNESESSYGSDYKELSVLKSLADKLSITIVIVHHTRKCSDNDPFNMISGSTGISGCVDGSMVLIETKRGSRKAVLHCVGRDIENVEINL